MHKNTAVMITKAIDGNTNNKKNISEDFEADMMNGFPWPPRCYICKFCKREFKSAQALGGHMNVHRKDRARFRSSPLARYSQSTILNLNLNPNPNPSFISSSSSTPFSTRQLFSPLSTTSFSSVPSWLSPSYYPPPYSFPSPSASYYHIHEKMKGFVGSNLRSLNQSREVRIHSKAEEVGCMMRLDLEIGVLGGNPSKDDIDLELRLG